MSEGARIFIVDDDEAVRDSLELLLRSSGFGSIVAYGSARNFLAEAAPMPGECLLLDVRMPDMDGLALQEELNRRGIKLPVIIMTGHGDVPIAVRAMKAAAMDFIEKPYSDELLVDCVRRARRQAEEARRGGAEADDVRRRLQVLTPREREVLQGMIAGQPNKLIAHALGISPRTVEIHRARVMDKMAARSLSALVRMALAAGIEPA